MSRFEYCRLCAKLRSTTIQIFEDLGMRKMLYLKILLNLNLKVAATDPLTKHVCILCVGKLEYLDRFRLDCHDALIYLRKRLYIERTDGPENEVVDLVDENDSLKSSKLENEKYINSTNLPDSAELSDEEITYKSSANVQQQSDTAKVYLETEVEDDLDVKMEVVEEDDDDDDDDADEEKDELDKENKDVEVEFKEINVSDVVQGNNSEHNLIEVMCETHFVYSDAHRRPDSSIDSKSKYGVMEIDNVNLELGGESIVKKRSRLSVVSDRDNVENRSEDESRSNAADEKSNDVDAPFVNSCDTDHDYDDDDNDCAVDNIDEQLNDNDVGNDHQFGDITKCAEVIDANMQVKPSISELYFRRENMREFENDNAAMLLQVFHYLENLYYGKCSFMPYFMKWPLPDGSFRVGFKCFCCTRFYFSRTDILDHIFEHLYSSCSLCKIQFRIKSKYIHHMSNNHFLDMKSKKFKCTFCSESMNSVSDYVKHVRQHHEYHCGLCSFHTPNHNKLTVHVKLDHSTSEKDCVDCLLLISDDINRLRTHILKITEESGFVCKFCGIGFHTEDFLKLHCEIYGYNHGHIVNGDAVATPGSSFDENTSQKTCDLVKLPTRNEGLFNRKVIKLFRDILDKKIKVHQLPLIESEMQGRGTVSKFQCPLCLNKIFNKEKFVITHVQNHLLQSCTKCQRLFHDLRRFKNHILKRHTAYDEYKCIICENVSFDKLSEYVSHIKIHTLKKMCDYCTEVFSNGREKETHIRRMHKDKLKKFICDYCGMSFIGSDRLKSHLSTHTDSKIMLICPDCGNGYKSRNNHKCFQKDKDQEYYCAYCSKVFKEKCRLISHINAHMDLKTFECKICKKCFNRLTSLQKHVKDMHSERKWKCTVDDCDKSYTYKSALESHMKKGHKCEILM